jgi:hypothetical protein
MFAGLDRYAAQHTFFRANNYQVPRGEQPASRSTTTRHDAERGPHPHADGETTTAQRPADAERATASDDDARLYLLPQTRARPICSTRAFPLTRRPRTFSISVQPAVSCERSRRHGQRHVRAARQSRILTFTGRASLKQNIGFAGPTDGRQSAERSPPTNRSRNTNNVPSADADHRKNTTKKTNRLLEREPAVSHGNL